MKSEPIIKISDIKIQIRTKLTCLTNNKFCLVLNVTNIMNKCLCCLVFMILVLTVQP